LINFVDRSQRANHYARPPATDHRRTYAAGTHVQQDTVLYR